MIGLLFALAQGHVFDGFDKGDLVKVTFTGDRTMSGWIAAMAEDRSSLQLDASYEFPELEGTVLVEAWKVKSVKALEAISPEEQARRVAAAKARLDEDEKLRVARELGLKQVEALAFTGSPTMIEEAPFTVKTDSGPDVARSVLKTIKEAFAEFGRTFRGARDAAMKYRVLVYSSRDSYKTYFERVHGRTWPETNRAFYTYADTTLVLLDQRDDEALETDLRHEAFHAFLHSFWVDAPAWFNEGLATYYETAGGANADRAKELALLEEVGVVETVERLREVGYQDYAYKTVQVGRYTVPRFYAQGWSLARYLMDDADRRKVLTRFLAAKQEGTSDDDAWTAATRDVNSSSLQADWERARAR